ncbi:uncharacterized protein LOC135218948 [Macrobrachium nipponense]|uniref:uncharacterized protein LOC135218948 n=1 Tax=Macrobrachium nipponense TaxID=159736 RepID=UPI0030C8BA5C
MVFPGSRGFPVTDSAATHSVATPTTTTQPSYFAPPTWSGCTSRCVSASVGGSHQLPFIAFLMPPPRFLPALMSPEVTTMPAMPRLGPATSERTPDHCPVPPVTTELAVVPGPATVPVPVPVPGPAFDSATGPVHEPSHSNAPWVALTSILQKLLKRKRSRKVSASFSPPPLKVYQPKKGKVAAPTPKMSHVETLKGLHFSSRRKAIGYLVSLPSPSGMGTEARASGASGA